jgi:hypothetical protein
MRSVDTGDMLRSSTNHRVRVLSITAVCGVLASSGLVACGGSSEPVPIAYEASSSVDAAIEVTYVSTDGKVTEVVESPWSLELEQSGSFSATLEVRNTGLDGEVACSVTSPEFPPVATGGEAAAFCRVAVQQEGGGRSVSTSTDFELFLRDADGDPVALPADAPEPQRAEAESVTYLDGGRVLLGGHSGVYVLDTSTGTVDRLPGSEDFGNPVEAAMGDDGTVFAVDIFKDLVQAVPAGATEVVDIAEFPDESPNGIWVVDGQLFVLLSGPDALLALDADGSERWRYEFPADVSKASVLGLGDGRMLVGSEDLPVVGLDVDTGEQLFESPVPDRLVEIVRHGSFVFFSFGSGPVGYSWGYPIDEVGDPMAGHVPVAGRRIVVDADDVPYAGTGGSISRLDKSNLRVDRTIELPDMTLLAVGDDVLYVSESERPGSDSVLISAVPTSLFD